MTSSKERNREVVTNSKCPINPIIRTKVTELSVSQTETLRRTPLTIRLIPPRAQSISERLGQNPHPQRGHML